MLYQLSRSKIFVEGGSKSQTVTAVSIADLCFGGRSWPAGSHLSTTALWHIEAGSGQMFSFEALFSDRVFIYPQEYGKGHTTQLQTIETAIIR